MDMAGNMKQISAMTVRGFTAKRETITLYLRLTRKSVQHLRVSELPPGFRETFDTFCAYYDQLEQEFHEGITDYNKWAEGIVSCARRLSDNAHLV